MKTVWVFDSFGKEIKKLDMTMLLASAKLWSIHCPEDTRVLYCSRDVRKTLGSLGKSKIFDEIILLSNLHKFQVNTSVFWAYPKLQVLSQIEEPVTVVDHDFMTFCNLREAINPSKVCYNYTEDAREYYPNNLDERVRNLNYKTRWPERSANVSFLQLPDPAFAKFYAGTSLQIMEEFSRMEAPNAKYLIFAEQMVLKHLLEDYQCLTKNIYICKEERFSSELDSRGIWTEEECWTKFEHYGPMKYRWSLSETRKKLEFLENIVNESRRS